MAQKLQSACCAMPDLKVRKWKENGGCRGFRNVNDGIKLT